MQASYACDAFFFFNDTATTEIYTLSLHDALPIYHFTTSHSAPGASARPPRGAPARHRLAPSRGSLAGLPLRLRDRKSTRLNSSHANISYAVFCLKKKKTKTTIIAAHLLSSNFTIL